MRIDSIKIRNIASLRGEHFINFDEIFSLYGIFAITGETGSGKTTILNAVSLALYGQNYKRNITHADFITLGELSGEIELAFTLEGKSYLSTWNCRISKSNGEKLKTPKIARTLYEIDEDKSQRALECLPDQLLNLTFDQFCKTMVLNQGEFSKFLISNFSERKEILERMYEGEKLETLSVLTKQKINETNIEIVNLGHTIKGLEEFNLADINLDQEIEILSNSKTSLKHTINGLENTHKKIEECYKLKLDYDKNVERSSNVKIVIQDITTGLNKIRLELNKQQEELNSFTHLFKQRTPELQKAIKDKQIIIAFENNLKNIDSLLTTNKEKLHKDESIVKSNSDQIDLHTNEIKRLQKQLIFQQVKLTSNSVILAKDNLNNLSSSLEKSTLIQKDLSHQDEVMSQLKLQGGQLNDKIELIESKRGKLSLEKLNHEKTIDHKKLEQNKLALNNLDKLIQDIVVLDEEISNLKNLNHKKESSLVVIQSTHKETLHKTEDINLALKYFELQQAILTCAEESIINGQCVICDSDYDKDSFNKLSLGKSTLSIEDQEKQTSLLERLKIATAEEKSLQLEIKEVEFSCKHNSQYITKGQRERGSKLKHVTEQYDFFCETQEDIQKVIAKLNESNLVLSNKIMSIEEQITGVTKKNTEINALRIQRDDLRKHYLETNTKQNVIKEQAILLEKCHQGHSTKLNDFFPSFKIEFLSDVSNDIDLHNKLIQSNSIKDEKNKSITEANSRIAILHKEILNGKSKETDITKQYILIKEQFEKIIGSSDPDTELNTLNQKRDELTEKVQNSFQKVKLEEITLAENQSKHKSFKEQCEQATNVFKISWLELIHLAESTSALFSKNVKLKALITAESTDVLRKLKTTPQINQVSAIIISKTYEVIKRIFDDVKDIYQNETGQLTKYLTLKEQRQEAEAKIKIVSKKIKEIEKIKTNYQDLYSVIGKDEFRNYVLALIEKNLLVQTNHELESLCYGRYKLMHLTKGIKMSPDFYVVDKFNNGMTRKISTLSGGEVFMVSLAMAIALAEMTRGSSEVDSFFIDEGFGTLDEDSLEDVLEMINNIKSRGKSIGLISHVKGLTNRIPVNIELNKNTIGNSTIQIIYN